MADLVIVDQTNGHTEPITTDKAPLEAIEEWFAAAPYDTDDADETIEVTIQIFEPDADGEWNDLEPLAEKRFTVDPPEPECNDEGNEHEWKRPWSVLGGTKEFPGLWDVGGGIMRQTEICRNCGRYRYTENHGNLDYEHVSYDEPDEASLDWVTKKERKRRKRNR